MEDTPRHIRELVYRAVMSRTPEERFLMCAEMFETGKELARINMPSGLSEDEQKAYIHKRIYNEDLPGRP